MDTKDTEMGTSNSAFAESISKLATWQRVLILALLIVGLSGAAAYFLYIPQFEEYSKLADELSALEKKLAHAKEIAAELPKHKARLEEAEAKFQIALKALPEKEEIPALLASVSKAGHEVGMEFLLFEPKGETKKEFYAEIPVALNISGDYHNLATFFDKVARLSRIVNITNISIDRGKQGRELNTSCTAVTYKFVEPPPSAAKPPTFKPNPAPAPAPGAGSGKKPKNNLKEM
jgi:type IV pilus assembly protein PilO